jgi:hypothetical protein
MGFKKKDKWEDLDEEFKDAVAAMSKDDIRNRIATIAMAQVELMKAKEDDEDLFKCREAAKEAGAIYRDGTKMNKLRIAFAKQVLDDKG